MSFVINTFNISSYEFVFILFYFFGLWGIHTFAPGYYPETFCFRKHTCMRQEIGMELYHALISFLKYIC